MRGLVAVYEAPLRPCCRDAPSITVVMIDVMCGVGFVGISLVQEATSVKSVGCGACRKGGNGGKWDETAFWGDTKPVVVCGVWRSRLAKEGGLNEEDKWIMLQ
jgi:hypothetical protein